MGYSKKSKGYKLWDTESHTFAVSRDVKFHETGDNCACVFDVQGDHSDSETLNVETSNEEDPPSHQNDNIDDTAESPENIDDNSLQDDVVSVEPISPAPPRRSTRQSKPPGEWWIASKSTNNNIPNNSETALNAANGDVPQSCTEATSPESIDFLAPGIKREEDYIRENKTLALVERKPGMYVLPCRNVFKIKNGGPKARICAKGYLQIHGMDYNETFAPVVSLAALRILLDLVAIFGLKLDQMDVITAFLNGDLDEIIYMKVPAGFKDPNRPNLVFKLLNALYGLRQAPRQWYAKSHDFQENELGFKSCPHVTCL